MTETKRSIWDRLAEPFQPNELETKDKGGKTLTYVKAWAIQDRLDAVVGPENWTVEITVTTADPRPVYTCTLRVKNPSNGIWAVRCATSGEPRMTEYKGGPPDFENGGKGGGTQAFKKAFQDGFCRYLMRGDQPDEVPIAWDKPKEPLPAKLDTDEKWNPPADFPADEATGPGWDVDMSPEQQAAELAKLKGPIPTDYSPLLKRGLSMDQINPNDPPCPTCGKRMWDGREPERGGKGQYPKKKATAPDWKCRDRACEGVLWPSK